MVIQDSRLYTDKDGLLLLALAVVISAGFLENQDVVRVRSDVTECAISRYAGLFVCWLVA